jgi:hypothetical protein
LIGDKTGAKRCSKQPFKGLLFYWDFGKEGGTAHQAGRFPDKRLGYGNNNGKITQGEWGF